MKIWELRRPLSEAPLGRLDVSGAASPQFHPADVKVMTSPRYQEKLSRIFSKTPMKVNVFALPVPDADYDDPEISMNLDGLYGEVSRDFLQDLGIKGGLPRNSKGVNLFILSNQPDTGEKTRAGQHPLTPWMVAHKLAHAVSETHGTYRKGVSAINDLFANAMNVDDRDLQELPALANKAAQWLTMKSARTGKLLPGELFYELATQWLVQGKATLTNDAPPGLAERVNKILEWYWSHAVGRSYWVT